MGRGDAESVSRLVRGPMISTRRVQASRALWEDEGEHFCDSTLDAPLTRGVHEANASLNWSLREQLSWGSAETHHFMFAHATGRLCTPPSDRLAAVLNNPMHPHLWLIVYRPAYCLYILHARRRRLTPEPPHLTHLSLTSGTRSDDTYRTRIRTACLAWHRTRLAVNSDRLAASQAWRSYRWSVVRNPLYWLTWLPTMLLIVAGRHVERDRA